DGLAIPDGETRLLFRTRNSELWGRAGFSGEFIALGPETAEVLVGRGVRLVAIDYLSIAPFGDPVPTHRAPLWAGVGVCEGVDLREAARGPYGLHAARVRLVGAEGAPTRALLRRRVDVPA